MQRLSLRFFTFLSLIIVLVACARPIQVNNFPDLTFSHLEKIRLNVAEIEIRETYTSPLQPPHVEAEMPISLSKTARKWAENILIPVGSTGKAVVTISKASVIEEKLKKNKGFSATFTTEQSERYISEVSVSIVADDGFGTSTTTRTSASRSTTVAEDVSLLQREKTWFTLIEKTTNDMGQKMHEHIHQFMQNFIR